MDLLEIKAIGECQVSRFADVVFEVVSTYPRPGISTGSGVGAFDAIEEQDTGLFVPVATGYDT
ncbi:hypothetical protein N7508_005257 [Penicillium antarcticum]|uniref:uncharacterized protein n=1 Tax=Penicillium antarcticum TaxID=416450 RepID=UPI0023A66021|nr:uncharacterized protein N7508_005257 [Penicillium antarcticum]KAJ5306242.1 hypothetical protein N7508_005257 [Penicillium antarcticum]